MKFQSVSQFKKDGKGSVVKSATSNPVVDEDSRLITFNVSSANVDSTGDVVFQDGIDTTNYKKNPVLLFAHNQDELPIGRCVSIGLDAKGLLTATFEIVPASTPCVGDRAEAVYQLCKSGFLFATSICFRPIDAERSDRQRGWDVHKCELMEISVVSVPANSDATIVDEPITVAEQPKAHSDINKINEDAVLRRKRITEVLKRKHFA